MAIKRVTIELDDALDVSRTTTYPTAGRAEDFTEAKKQNITSAAGYADEENAASTPEPSPPKPTVGRTFSDLIASSVDDARVMATLLMLIPFAIFATKIEKLSDLCIPAVVGVILNFVWFIASFAQRKAKKADE
jgi:hypothetical protein